MSPYNVPYMPVTSIYPVCSLFSGW